MSQLERLEHAFEVTFHCTAEAIYQAPGRVNLIGEHTDYNDGFVLPCAINYQTLVACKRTNHRLIELLACDYDDTTHAIALDNDIERVAVPEWANYIRGVVREFQLLGTVLSGMQLAITGNVPQGAGLSSSAALEVAIATALNDQFDVGLSATEIALLAQRAENDFVGCNCGIMDQLISATGKQQGAQLIDCRDLSTRDVKLPQELQILVINSNVKRGLVDSEYNLRREQCEAVASHFGVPALRDIDPLKLAAESELLDPELYRRARHVVSENERTLLAADALNSNNISTVSRLMAESHQSMRDDFNITVPAIDWLVAGIDKIIDRRGGVRMTGGGFGGCVVALVPRDLVAAVVNFINADYSDANNGLVADIYQCNSSQGASRVR